MRNLLAQEIPRREPAQAGRLAKEIYQGMEWPDQAELPPWQSLFTLSFGAQLISKALPRDPGRVIPGGWEKFRLGPLNDPLWKTDISREIEAVLAPQLGTNGLEKVTWKAVADFTSELDWSFAPISAICDLIEWEPEYSRELVRDLVVLLPWPVDIQVRKNFSKQFANITKIEEGRADLLVESFLEVLRHSDNDIPLMYQGSLARSKEALIETFNPHALWASRRPFLWLGSEVARASELVRLEDYEPMAVAESDPTGPEDWTLKQHVNLADGYVPFRRRPGRPPRLTDVTPQEFVDAYRLVAEKNVPFRNRKSAVAVALPVDPKQIDRMLEAHDWTWKMIVDSYAPDQRS